MESQAWLMMLSSNWRVTPVYYVYTRVATCMAPERPRVPGRASKSSLSIVLLYLAKCSLHCTALPLLLKLRDVRNRLPHVFCSWAELPVLCVIIASHLYVRQSEKTHGTNTTELLPAIVSGQYWGSCHLTHQDIPKATQCSSTSFLQEGQIMVNCSTLAGWTVMLYTRLYNPLNLCSS